MPRPKPRPLAGLRERAPTDEAHAPSPSNTVMYFVESVSDLSGKTKTKNNQKFYIGSPQYCAAVSVGKDNRHYGHSILFVCFPFKITSPSITVAPLPERPRNRAALYRRRTRPFGAGADPLRHDAVDQNGTGAPNDRRRPHPRSLPKRDRYYRPGDLPRRNTAARAD